MLFAPDHTKHCKEYVIYDLYIKRSSNGLRKNKKKQRRSISTIIVNCMFPENDDFSIDDTRAWKEILVLPIGNEPMNFWAQLFKG